MNKTQCIFFWVSFDSLGITSSKPRNRDITCLHTNVNGLDRIVNWLYPSHIESKAGLAKHFNHSTRSSNAKSFLNKYCTGSFFFVLYSSTLTIYSTPLYQKIPRRDATNFASELLALLPMLFTLLK